MRLALTLLAGFASFAIGLSALVAYGLLIGPAPPEIIHVPAIPALHAARMALGFPSLLVMFVAGLLAGVVRPGSWWQLGLACAFAVPFVLASDVVMLPPGYHNFWPFEFAIYLPLALPALPGALLGHTLSRGLSKRGELRGRT